MASCRSCGMTMSRISTDMTVMPHTLVRSSMTSCSSWSSWLRRMATSDTLARPMASRRAVWAASDTEL